MKRGIHPKYYDPATITCSCGTVFKIGSTKEKMQVEICSACHPFYTGKKRITDTTGRVDRFKKLAEKATFKKETARKTAIAKKRKMERKEAKGPDEKRNK